MQKESSALTEEKGVGRNKGMESSILVPRVETRTRGCKFIFLPHLLDLEATRSNDVRLRTPVKSTRKLEVTEKAKVWMFLVLKE